MRVRIIDNFSARMGLGKPIRGLELTAHERQVLLNAIPILERADQLTRRIDEDPEGENEWHEAELAVRSAINSWA